MTQCPECESESRKIEVLMYQCKNCDYIIHVFGLEDFLERIGVREEIITEIRRQINATNVGAAFLN